jgi:hypothetical protein
MAIADCKEMLPSLVVDIGSDDEVVLVDLPCIVWYKALPSAVGEAHDVLKELFLLGWHLRAAKVLPDEIEEST